MLKKVRKPENDKDSPADKIIEQKTFAPALSVETRDEKTIIGEHISIEGNITGEGHMVIEGSMKGKVEMQKYNFAVASKGRFEGEIHAQNVSISGQMNGNIKAQGKVEITKAADFLGEIRAKSISVEEGAYFKGAIELDREPHRNKTLAEKSATVAAPPPVREPKFQVDKASNKGA